MAMDFELFNFFSMVGHGYMLVLSYELGGVVIEV
jgi:hypothetical protein